MYCMNVKKSCFSIKGIFYSLSEVELYPDMNLEVFLIINAAYLPRMQKRLKKKKKEAKSCRDNIILIFRKQQNCFYMEYYNPGLFLFSVVLSHFSTLQSVELFSVPD